VKGCEVALCLKHKGKVYDKRDTTYLSPSDGGENNNAHVAPRCGVIRNHPVDPKEKP